MNKFKAFVSRNKANITALGFSVAGAITAYAPNAHAVLADDIGDIADSVGTSFQTSSVTLLTAVLPYVVTVAIIFLAAKLALRWMKKSAR